MIRVPTISVKHNWRNATNRLDRYGVHLRVYLSGEQARHYPIEISSKISVQEWLGKDNHWVKNTHPFFFEINCKIAETVNKLNDLVKRHYTQNKPVTFYRIEKELMLRGRTEYIQ
ncbi:MAG: hypothetical protein ABS85_08770 [Sphingobacteriales bacterium SCN 48-20]|uniref:hypothetical protein n=1 Tax=Terrimonas ferruginea TaxID=249 RepID=UPI000868BBA1|nr:hypothetical protein [Terrimonas ferruginea]MBN8783565.1 hypothetical protein [Terrimonas ferruginea]ODT92562.1 MAG: hypothetical protein ABS85_08770 [Sphingobacteriales bacterium SCN 48-20]OJW40317.1 MAG: hypothetical protein BGO56_09715 [Sphingobacteriales bacterium 48-107]